MKSFRLIFGSALIALGIAGILVFRAPLTERLFSLSVGFKGMTDSTYSYGTFISLRNENEGLKAELERLRAEKGRVINKTLLEARVFSRFPANTRSSIAIDRGSDDGMKEGMLVFSDAAQTLLVGRIVRTSPSQSEVYTFFDTEWKSSVEVGNTRIKALLTGGNPPHIDLLPKDAAVVAGDRVTNASAEYPMGAFLGLIGTIEFRTNDIWQNARLNPIVFPDTLDRVFVLREFP